MCSRPESEHWIKKMYQERGKQKLSLPSLETLAIIAYKQPITRMEIESIRGVNIDGVVRHLLDLGLIKTEGRKEVVGRPFLYITTRKFLEYFGLNVLKDLPRLEEFVALAEKDSMLKKQNNAFASTPQNKEGEQYGSVHENISDNQNTKEEEIRQ